MKVKREKVVLVKESVSSKYSMEKLTFLTPALTCSIMRLNDDENFGGTGGMGIKFQDLESFDIKDVDAAISRNDADELQLVPVTVAISFSDRSYAEEVCLRLSLHSDSKVRGNAVMSLGHLARRFRKLDEETVKPVIESALRDPDEYVRVHAKSAADEIHQFLCWNIAGHIYG